MEVRRLARLKNVQENIVIYDTAWLEKVKRNEIRSTRSITNESMQVDSEVHEMMDVARASPVFLSSAPCSLVAEMSPVAECSFSVTLPRETGESRRGINTKETVLNQSDNQVELRSDSTTNERPSLRPTYYCLYIQMELCKMSLCMWLNDGRDLLLRNGRSHVGYEKVLLRDWITRENVCETYPSKPLFSFIKEYATSQLLEGIVNGLNYIHRQNMAHQDLHLGNILVDINDSGFVTPRISDFDLAKTLSSNAVNNCEHLPKTSYAIPHQVVDDDDDEE